MHMEQHQLNLIEHARDLRGEHGENPEYDRALIELTTRALGLSHDDDGPTIERMILGGRDA